MSKNIIRVLMGELDKQDIPFTNIEGVGFDGNDPHLFVSSPQGLIDISKGGVSRDLLESNHHVPLLTAYFFDTIGEILKIIIENEDNDTRGSKDLGDPVSIEDITQLMMNIMQDYGVVITIGVGYDATDVCLRASTLSNELTYIHITPDGTRANDGYGNEVILLEDVLKDFDEISELMGRGKEQQRVWEGM